MTDKPSTVPDHTAVRVALWRAIHVQVDAPPHIIEDKLGLRLANPDEGWRNRPDMNPQWTSLFRASIVARARLIEDLVVEQSQKGVGQYVILGAGLDTFAQRRPEILSKLCVFEVDQPDTQVWKKNRLMELGLGLPENLKFVPVNFESGESWLEKLATAGFDPKKPAVVVSTGVSMYLTKEATLTTFRQVAGLATGTKLAMTYLLPMELMDDEVKTGFEMAMKGAKAAGTPFISFYTPQEIQAMAREAGFKEAHSVSGDSLNQRYFAGRTDGFHMAKSEDILVVTI